MRLLLRSTVFDKMSRRHRLENMAIAKKTKVNIDLQKAGIRRAVIVADNNLPEAPVAKTDLHTSDFKEELTKEKGYKLIITEIVAPVSKERK